MMNCYEEFIAFANYKYYYDNSDTLEIYIITYIVCTALHGTCTRGNHRIEYAHAWLASSLNFFSPHSKQLPCSLVIKVNLVVRILAFV